MTTRIILLAILFVILTVLAFRSRTQPGMWKVYGTMGCGWTRKQLDHMKKNGISYMFVDCSSENCSDVNAFPTMIHSQSGETVVGYKEI